MKTQEHKGALILIVLHRFFVLQPSSLLFSAHAIFQSTEQQGSPWLSPYMEKLSPAVDILGHTISVVL